jgi:putative transposase
VRHIDLLRDARVHHPFIIHGWVVLPDHLHCVIELPQGDDNFAIRWKLNKSNFSRRIEKTEWRSAVRERRGERGIWRRRFWEHLIRDERDFQTHMD